MPKLSDPAVSAGSAVWPVSPYGGELVDLTTDQSEITDRALAATKRLILTATQTIHLRNIGTGCYSPLTGFMTQVDFQSVLAHGKLSNGLDWKVPILFHVEEKNCTEFREGADVALCNAGGHVVATMTVESLFDVDPDAYCDTVMGTCDRRHPGVARIREQSRLCIGGPVKLCGSKITAERFENAPARIRARLESSGAGEFAAFSTRNISHRGHDYQHRVALDRAGFLGIHVITGAAVAGNFMSDVVLDTYQMLTEEIYPPGKTLLNNMRLPPIYAGPKEAFLQATVLQNMGFTHFIVGRDHAGVGNYYSRYESQEIFAAGSTLDILIMALPEPQYCPHCNDIVTEGECQHPDDLKKLNGRDVRRFLAAEDYSALNEILRPEVRDMIIARHSAGSIFIES